MTLKEVAPKRPNLWTSLDPYAQLITTLLPRATGIAAFDAEGELRWTSEVFASDAEFPQLIHTSRRNAAAQPHGNGELTVLHGDTPVYTFWLRNDAGLLIAILAIVWRSGETEQRQFEFVYTMAKPALEVLRREIVSRASIDSLNSTLFSRDRDLESRDRDLEVLLSASGDDGRDSVDTTDDLKSILQNATDHLRCSLTALIVPEKSLVVMRTSGDQAPDRSVLAKTHRHLMSLAQMRREPVIIDKFAPSAVPGSPRYRILSCPIRHPSGRSMGVLALFRSQDDPEFVEREARLADLLSRRAAAIIEGCYDALTGLLTRPAFEQRARGIFAEMKRERRWSALYIDTDQLHAINDNFGMHVGDRVISQLGELIRTRMPPGAFAARISGDRFAILLPTSAQDACDFAEALRLGATDLGSFGTEVRLSTSVSIGVAAIDGPKIEFAHAFAAAETACKAAKDRGRSRVELYQDSDLSIMHRYEDINIALRLRQAIEENRLRLHAQLILPLAGGSSSPPHFELLLRMLDDDGNTVGPDRFLSAAVRYQLMPTIDRWVIQQAVTLLKPHAALLAARGVVFTINFSGQSLIDPEFADSVIRLIEGSGLNPAIFCFELTESAAIANLHNAEELIRRLKKLGCDVALDDFGTGLSSLAYLRSLPVGMLKIDGSFVRDILKDPRAESMVKAIAHLARSMNLVTVAEYVETDEIRMRVAALGVDYAQGFAIGRPTSFIDLLGELPMYMNAQSVTVQEQALPDADLLDPLIEVQLLEDEEPLHRAIGIN
ncbi:MAG: EAL domain-containing protein [Steroidobacteraceae bacterium]